MCKCSQIAFFFTALLVPHTVGLFNLVELPRPEMLSTSGEWEDTRHSQQRQGLTFAGTIACIPSWKDADTRDPSQRKVGIQSNAIYKV